MTETEIEIRVTGAGVKAIVLHAMTEREEIAARELYEKIQHFAVAIDLVLLESENKRWRH